METYIPKSIDEYIALDSMRNSHINSLLEEIIDKIELSTKIGIGLLLILSIIIIFNQVRIRKQLRRIQEQLEQKENGEE